MFKKFVILFIAAMIIFNARPAFLLGTQKVSSISQTTAHQLNKPVDVAIAKTWLPRWLTYPIPFFLAGLGVGVISKRRRGLINALAMFTMIFILTAIQLITKLGFKHVTTITGDITITWAISFSLYNLLCLIGAIAGSAYGGHVGETNFQEPIRNNAVSAFFFGLGVYMICSIVFYYIFIFPYQLKNIPTFAITVFVWFPLSIGLFAALYSRSESEFNISLFLLSLFLIHHLSQSNILNFIKEFIVITGVSFFIFKARNHPRQSVV